MTHKLPQVQLQGSILSSGSGVGALAAPGSLGDSERMAGVSTQGRESVDNLPVERLLRS